MNSKEFFNNEKIVTKIGTVIDNLNKVTAGHVLLSITKDKVRNLLLLTKEHSSFIIYKWKIDENIEKVVGVEIHEEELTDNITQFINNNCNAGFRRAELVSALVTESLNGFSTNKISANQLINLKNKDDRYGPSSENKVIEDMPEAAEFIPIGKRILTSIHKIRNNITAVIDDLIKKNDIEIKIDHQFQCYELDRIFIGEITNVKEIGGRRHFEVKWNYIYNNNDQIKYGRVSASCSPAVEAVNIKTHKNNYIFNKRSHNFNEELNPTTLDQVPYNLVDKGRLIVALPENSYFWNFIIGPDPKIIKDHKETFEKDLVSFLSQEIELSHSIVNANLLVPKIATLSYHSYENNQHRINPDLTGLRLKLKSFKVMAEEFNYLTKKNNSIIGQDVTITENIKYNHEKGKISYNDFSISIQDDLVKAKLYILFNSYLMKYFRSEVTEQDVLDCLISDTFKAIEARLNMGAKVDLDLPIRINDKIDIRVLGKISTRYKKQESITKEKIVASQGQLFYINDQRFNKNEVIMILKEMTCYREQVEADNFITNIGRLGLSSYIGISTGYEVSFGENDNKLFRFKKLKGGRSNYELLLEDTTIPIKGKKLINILYSRFIGEYVSDFINKIPELIYELSGSSMHYLKYRVLIDSTYKAFKDKSREYLNKKVDELQGQHVKYFNKKAHKVIDGILIKGTSGKTYVIAYNSKDSYVFMEPEKNESGEYKEGKYICMIDQSNIKSNISYDTIVSKLLALKNDSSIAHTIYNLQEELE